jgi:hypothetical protein
MFTYVRKVRIVNERIEGNRENPENEGLEGVATERGGEGGGEKSGKMGGC